MDWNGNRRPSERTLRAPMNPALEFAAATKSYNRVAALDRLTLQVAPGELFGFLGPNGAGKTTAMRTAAGLVRLTSGRIWVDGNDVERNPVAAKRLVGFVPDNPFLYESLTGREFLHFCAGLYGIDDLTATRRVERLCDWFAIGDWIDTRTGQYSHGMKQRVVMASAFIHQPKVLLIDEPMVGLDPASVRLVKTVLRRFCDEGGAVFLSTHTLADAEELCDRIGVINQGRLVACGATADLVGGARLEDAYFSLTSASAG